MEKGDGRGTGNFLELDAGIGKGNHPGRGKWSTYGTKDEEVITKVMGKLNFILSIITNSKISLMLKSIN